MEKSMVNNGETKHFFAPLPLHCAFRYVQRKNHPQTYPFPVQAQRGRQGVSGGWEGGLLRGTREQPPSRPLT